MKATNGIETVVKGSTKFMGDDDDDDQDLEALRLAALESLRAKGLPPPPVRAAATNLKTHQVPEPSPYVYRQHTVNQNLISIIPFEDVSKKPVAEAAGSSDRKDASFEGAKMTSLMPSSLPVSEDEDKPKVSSKFSRYEDSDSDDSEDLDLDLELKKLSDESDSEECELEIGVSEDLLLQSPPPPGALSAAVGQQEKKEEIHEKIKEKPDQTQKAESSKIQEGSKDPGSKKSAKPEKSKSDKPKESKRRKSSDSKKPSSRRSPRRESPSSRKPKSKQKTPERSLNAKEGRDSPVKHRSRNQSPSTRKPSAPQKPSSPAPVHRSEKPVDSRRSRSRSPPRSKKPHVDNSAKPPSQRTTAEQERLDARKRKFESSVDGAEFQPRKIKLGKDSEESTRRVDKRVDRKEKKPSTPTSEAKSKEVVKAVDQKEESSDLRTELQRRRVNRGLVKDTTVQPSAKDGNSTESRRILVFKSKVTTPEDTGKPSIRERLGAVDAGSVSTSSSTAGRIKLKRPAPAATSVEADKGNHVESIEERMRRIQAMNDALLKRHLELEADKLLFA